MTLYALLDADARNWWYHKQLRKQGQVAKARKKERDSIRSNVKTLRAALASGGYCTVGRGGATIHYTAPGYGHCRHQGYDDINGTDPQACLRVGIPVIDTTTIPDDVIVWLSPALPLIEFSERRQDPPPWGGLSCAPRDPVLAAYAHFGATVYNIDLPPFDPSLFRSMTGKETRLLTSFMRGDEMGVFRAMYEDES